MPTEADIRSWVAATRPADWYGKCAGLTDRVVATFTGGSRLYYASAAAACKASGPLSPDFRKCPPGGVHFWSYFGADSQGQVAAWGHVTIDIRGGGTATLSATHYAFENWGVSAGLISVPGQSARAGMTYLGWSRAFGTAKPLIIGESTAGVGPLTPIQEDDMPLTSDEIDRIAAAVWDRQIPSEDGKSTYTAALRLRGANLTTDAIAATVGRIPMSVALAPIGDGSGDPKRDRPLWQVLAGLVTDTRKTYDAVTPGVTGVKLDGALYALVKGLTAPAGAVDVAALAKAIIDAGVGRAVVEAIQAQWAK